MFSFFMKKSSPEVVPEQPAEIPPFDFTSAIPSGWGIHVGGRLYGLAQGHPHRVL